MVRIAGVEPACLSTSDFKSDEYTCFSISAYDTIIYVLSYRVNKFGHYRYGGPTTHPTKLYLAPDVMGVT